VVWADFPSLAPYVSSVPQYREIPQFPVVARDLALIADRDIPAAQVEEVIRKRAKSLLVSLNLFDVYEGERIPQGKKSLAYQMQFSAPDRTLTDEEVNQLITKIISDLKAKLGVDLRS
jgi:phenylalanyl-tRNA synthetase beta chain